MEEDINKICAGKYTALLNDHGSDFSDWLQERFITDVSIFKFTMNPEYAIGILNEFKPKSNILKT
jgi:hypothetical protein